MTSKSPVIFYGAFLVENEREEIIKVISKVEVSLGGNLRDLTHMLR